MPVAEIISSTSKKRRQCNAIEKISDFLEERNIDDGLITTRQVLESEIPQSESSQEIRAFVTDIVDLEVPLPLGCFDLLRSLYQDSRLCKIIRDYGKGENLKKNATSEIASNQAKSTNGKIEGGEKRQEEKIKKQGEENKKQKNESVKKDETFEIAGKQTKVTGEKIEDGEKSKKQEEENQEQESESVKINNDDLKSLNEIDSFYDNDREYHPLRSILGEDVYSSPYDTPEPMSEKDISSNKKIIGQIEQKYPETFAEFFYPIQNAGSDGEAKKIFENQYLILEAASKGAPTKRNADSLSKQYREYNMKLESEQSNKAIKIINPDELILRDYFIPSLILSLMGMSPEVKEETIRNEIYEVLRPNEKLYSSIIKDKQEQLEEQIKNIAISEGNYLKFNAKYEKTSNQASKKANKGIDVDESAAEKFKLAADTFKGRFPNHVNTTSSDTNAFYDFVKDTIVDNLNEVANLNNDEKNSDSSFLDKCVAFFENEIANLESDEKNSESSFSGRFFSFFKDDKKTKEEKKKRRKEKKEKGKMEKKAREQILQLSKKIDMKATNAKTSHAKKLQEAETEEDQKYLTDSNLFEYLLYTYNEQIKLLATNGLIMDDIISNTIIGIISSFFVPFDIGTPPEFHPSNIKHNKRRGYGGSKSTYGQKTKGGYSNPNGESSKYNSKVPFDTGAMSKPESLSVNPDNYQGYVGSKPINNITLGNESSTNENTFNFYGNYGKGMDNQMFNTTPMTMPTISPMMDPRIMALLFLQMMQGYSDFSQFKDTVQSPKTKDTGLPQSDQPTVTNDQSSPLASPHFPPNQISDTDKLLQVKDSKYIEKQNSKQVQEDTDDKKETVSPTIWGNRWKTGLRPIIRAILLLIMRGKGGEYSNVLEEVMKKCRVDIGTGDKQILQNGKNIEQSFNQIYSDTKKYIDTINQLITNKQKHYFNNDLFSPEQDAKDLDYLLNILNNLENNNYTISSEEREHIVGMFNKKEYSLRDRLLTNFDDLLLDKSDNKLHILNVLNQDIIA